MHIQGSHQNRLHGVGLDRCQIGDVGRLAVSLHSDDIHGAGADLHVPRQETLDALPGNGVHRTEHGAQLVGDVLIEDAGSLVEVLGDGDEAIDVLPRVDPRVVVGAGGGVVHELLVGEIGGRRSEPRVADADDGNPAQTRLLRVGAKRSGRRGVWVTAQATDETPRRDPTCWKRRRKRSWDASLGAASPSSKS